MPKRIGKSFRQERYGHRCTPVKRAFPARPPASEDVAMREKRDQVEAERQTGVMHLRNGGTSVVVDVSSASLPVVLH